MINDTIYNNIILGLGYTNGIHEIKYNKYYGKVMKYLKKLNLDRLIYNLDKNIYEM